MQGSPAVSTITDPLCGFGGLLASGAMEIHSALEMPKHSRSAKGCQLLSSVSDVLGGPCHAHGSGWGTLSSTALWGSSAPCMLSDPTISTTFSKDTHLWAEVAWVA